MDLFQHSIDVILANQHAGGGYVASPAFETYHYCWLRDGSFIAHAMDAVGRHDSAARFYRWVGRTITRHASKVDVLAAQLAAGQKPDNRAILNTRFTLEGFEEVTDDEGEWGNFQIDGYGAWLWGLAGHVKTAGDDALLAELRAPIDTTLRYLALAWQLPNYDCWEEHPEYLHPYSLATIYGGLTAVADLQSSGKLTGCPFDAAGLAAEVKAFLSARAVLDGRFSKHLWPAADGLPARPIAASGVDASLLGLAVPYGVFDLHDPLITATVAAIENDLHRPGGGVYRYREDVYYGGGEWIILAAWLGLYYARAGQPDRARDLLAWIERCAAPNGDLTEQVSEHLLTPAHFEPWRQKWGDIANPLLWSHAMYILLVQQLSA